MLISAEKHRNRRQAQKMRKADLLNQLFAVNKPQDDLTGSCGLINHAMVNHEIAIKIDSIFVAEHRYDATFFSSIKSTTPLGYLSCENSYGFR